MPEIVPAICSAGALSVHPQAPIETGLVFEDDVSPSDLNWPVPGKAGPRVRLVKSHGTTCYGSLDWCQSAYISTAIVPQRILGTQR